MVVKSNGNMYPDKDTWNPLGGSCTHDCSYCYRKTWINWTKNCANKYTGEVRLWESEFKSLGNKKEIFVCSMTDLFAKNVPKDHINKIINHCKKYDNIYLFQTKNPSRFLEFYDSLPSKSILGTTIETNRNLTGYSTAPNQQQRTKSMSELRELMKKKKESSNELMVSIEPVMEFDMNSFVDLIESIKPDYVSIGADSKDNNLAEPNSEKLTKFIKALKQHTSVKKKSNLSRILDE